VVLGVQAYCTDCTGPHATASFCIISRRAVFVLQPAPQQPAPQQPEPQSNNNGFPDMPDPFSDTGSSVDISDDDLPF